MPTFLTLALLTAFAQDPYSLPGTFAWGERNLPASPELGGAGAKVYYPALGGGGLNSAVDPAGVYPVITFAHGFVIPPSAYDSTLRHLATRGYIVIATESQTFNFNPDRLDYIADFRRTIDFIIDENSRVGSDFLGRVDTQRIGASGHSLGGGVSIVAAAEDSRIKASATLAAASLRDAGPLGPAPPPYADVDIASLDIPVSLINGSLDTLIPVATNGQVIYHAADGPRMLPNIVGGFHVGFTDLPLPPPLGDAGQPGSITLEENLAFGRAELTSFFDLYLKQDQSAWRRQWGPERLALAGIDTQLDPGFTLIADDTDLLTTRNQEVSTLLTITNTSDHSDAYELFVEDNLWSVVFTELITPELAPGESYTIEATITALGSSLELSDVALLSARSVLDGGTRAFTVVTTSVPEFSSWGLSGLAVVGLIFAHRVRGNRNRGPLSKSR